MEVTTYYSDVNGVINEFHQFRQTKDDNSRGILVLCGKIGSNILSRATKHYTKISGNEVLAGGIDTSVILLRPNESSKLIAIINEEEELLLKQNKPVNLKMFFYNLHHVITEEKEFVEIFENRINDCVFYEDLEDEE